MNKFLLLFLSVIFFSNNYSQSKYFIYFNDKGLAQGITLNKNSALYAEAIRELSPRAIERRKAVLGSENFITKEDLPLSINYINELEKRNIIIENRLKWFNAVTAYLSDEQIEQLKSLSFIKKIEGVKKLSSANPTINEAIQPQQNIVLKKTTALDYGFSFTQNNLSEIPAVHDAGITGEGVLIGILDTGFRWKTHPALQTKTVLAERDFIQKDDNTSNQSGDLANQDSHGTAVFSICAGYAPGTLIGPAFNSQFLLAKTEDVGSEKNVEEDNYAAALEWMEAQGVDITTSSLGYRMFDKDQNSYSYQDMNGNTTIVTKAANLAFQRGVSTITSAGNEGMDLISAPGDGFNMITVGAVTSQNLMASFSSRGPSSDGRIKPEIVAQGVSVFHAVAGATFGSGSGTSYSAPIVAGIAGLLKSAYPHLTNRQIRSIFLESGDNAATPNNDRGYGLISAKKAVTFPNLSYNTDNTFYNVNKLFINSSGIKTASVMMHYSINSGVFNSVFMNYNGKQIYSYPFTNLQSGSSFDFYFTYETNNGTSVREPAANNYKFKFGNELVTLTDLNDKEELPNEFVLEQNYPNPFNPETTIKFSIPNSQFVSLKVFDILGKEVSTILNEYKPGGVYNLKFSVLDSQLSSGVYFYHLKAGEFTQVKKMVLMK